MDKNKLIKLINEYERLSDRYEMLYKIYRTIYEQLYEINLEEDP